MMFLNCPAYLDEDGARRCGLPAEVRCRFTMRSSDGPVVGAMIRCPSGHWFNGAIESLTWEGEETHHPGKAGVASSATVGTAAGGAAGLGTPGTDRYGRLLAVSRACRPCDDTPSGPLRLGLTHTGKAF